MELVSEARKNFSAPGPYAVCIALDNARRRALCVAENARLAPDVAPTAFEDTPVRLYVGMVLLGCRNDRRMRFLNACETRVLAITAEGLEVSGGLVAWEEARISFRLPHAVTIAASQSRTYAGRVLVCPGSRPGHTHRMLTPRHLNVACSRCTSSLLLCVE